MSSELDDLLKAAETKGTPKAVSTERMSIRVTTPMEVTIRHLKAAIEKNPEHPIAKSFQKAVDISSNDDEIVAVDKKDVIALLKDQDVTFVTKDVKDPANRDKTTPGLRRKLVARSKPDSSGETAPSSSPAGTTSSGSSSPQKEAEPVGDPRGKGK